MKLEQVHILTRQDYVLAGGICDGAGAERCQVDQLPQGAQFARQALRGALNQV